MHNQATVAVTYKGTHTSQTKVFLYTWERKPNKSMIPRSISINKQKSKVFEFMSDHLK